MLHYCYFYFRYRVINTRKKEAKKAVAQGAGMCHRRSGCCSYEEEGMFRLRWLCGSAPASYPWERGKNKTVQLMFWRSIGNIVCFPPSFCFLESKAIQWSYFRDESVSQENSGTTQIQFLYSYPTKQCDARNTSNHPKHNEIWHWIGWISEEGEACTWHVLCTCACSCPPALREQRSPRGPHFRKTSQPPRI